MKTNVYGLRWRLMLTYILLIVVGFGGLALFAGQQLSDALKESFASRIKVQALLMGNGLYEWVERVDEGEVSQKRLINHLATLPVDPGAEVMLLDSQGKTWLNTTEAMPQEDLSALPEVAAALKQEQEQVVDFRNQAGTSMLYAAAPVLDDNEVIAVMHLSVPMDQVQRDINSRWLTLGVGVVVMTLIALVTSLWLSRSLTHPLSRLRNSALKLAKGDFSERFTEQRRDEIGELAKSLNYMANEVQGMLDEQRAFASNASHELRTPLTTIGLRTELLRSGELDEATAERYINEIDQEVGRLNGLVDDLIWLSRFEANRVTLGKEQF